MPGILYPFRFLINTIKLDKTMTHEGYACMFYFDIFNGYFFNETDNKWEFGRLFCELWISLDILLCTASILSLCAISIDRYLAITRPLAYSRRRRSKRLALSMISCVWIAAVVITSPPIFGW